MAAAVSGRPLTMSRKRLQQLVDTLGHSTKHFNKSEVECLIKLFDKLVAESSSRFAAAGFDRNMFRDILHSAFGMTDEMLMDREITTAASVRRNGWKAYQYFFGGHWKKRSNKEADGAKGEVWLHSTVSSQPRPVPTFIYRRNGDTAVIALIPTVLQLGKMDGKTESVYDLNGDGYISREEMFQMLKNCLLKQPSEEDPDEGVKDLVDIAMKKMDYDRDGKLSFKDFEKAVRDENLLLEAFGPCLADIKSRMAFEQKTFRETL